MHDFVEETARQLSGVGLVDAEEVRRVPESSSFGDSAVVFRLGQLLLRFSQDRGEAFLDVATVDIPDVFYQFDDIDIAMGWKSIEEVLAKREPEDLGLVLGRIHANRCALSEAFSADNQDSTLLKIQRASRDRGRAFADRLRAGGGEAKSHSE